MKQVNKKLEEIVALTKRRGFIYPGSEIYGGLGGFYDYGPLGLALKENIKKLWWRTFVEEREEMFGVDAAIIMHPQVWQASGHVEGFADPLPASPALSAGRKTRGKTQQFNLMFKTDVGASEEATTSYLRPETAQGIFANFKNIVDSFHPKLPFGIAQVGKAFRNEIAPREFLFRLREFEQMEIEYFVKENDWEKYFAEWRKATGEWLKSLGLAVNELEVSEGERAHYSKRTIDFEYDFPFGRRELCGLAYRTDFDLRRHQEMSKVDQTYFEEDPPTGGKERFIPHVIEPTFGLDRLVLAVLAEAYDEDELGGERRVVLRLPVALAPIKMAVFPLLKNKPELVARAREIYQKLREHSPAVAFDNNDNIGKRYRRQDEIGTPHCVTVDFQTIEDGTVTLRDRDTGEQKRVKPGGLTF